MFHFIYTFFFVLILTLRSVIVLRIKVDVSLHFYRIEAVIDPITAVQVQSIHTIIVHLHCSLLRVITPPILG